MATRQGRTAIAKELSEDSPHELLKRAGGTTGAFLRHFPLCDGEALQDYPEKQVLRGGATFRSQIGVQDAMTINPSYNRLGTLRAAAPQGWVRSICIQLAAHIHREFNAYPTDVEDLDPEVLKASELWIADPDSFSVLKKLSPKTAILPVEGVAPIGLSGLVGELFLDKEFGVETHERFKRWEVVSNVGYTLVIHNWGNVKALPLLGVSAHAEVM
jgi:hypothetical protein